MLIDKLIFLYAICVLCGDGQLYDGKVNPIMNVLSNSSQFPHKINEDFVIVIYHPNIESHNRYALFVNQINCSRISEFQRILVYPGHLKSLHRIEKEEYFHLVNLRHSHYLTCLTFRLFRPAHNCVFTIKYSAYHAQEYHKSLPIDFVSVYEKLIHLFRLPYVLIDITADDGHDGGLKIGKKSNIKCKSFDGFPEYPLKLNIPPKVDIMFSNSFPNEVNVEFIALLEHHLTNVTCQSGAVTTSKEIRVFHHPISVTVNPDRQHYFKQNSMIECISNGDGYPPPTVIWSIIGLNATTKSYFTITTSGRKSVLKINANAPNNSFWMFNCSSTNVIPLMDNGGPFRLFNITIGEPPEAARMLAARIWTITFVTIIVFIVLLIGILCIFSRVRCESRHEQKIRNKVDLSTIETYKPGKEIADDQDPQISISEKEFFV